MTIAIIAPEPAPWLGPVLEAARAVQGARGVRVLAPWAAARPLPAWMPLPGRMHAFWQRRSIPMGGTAESAASGDPAGAPALVRVPGWLLGEGALRAWAGARADRTLRARFALRALVDRMAARWLTRHGAGAGIVAVVAPSCAAWRSFAAAARGGARTFLVEDLPDIRGLHADLDRAARVHPQCAFLHRFRAPRHVIVRQEAERVLAGHVLVRGAHARAQQMDAGRDPGHIIDLLLPAPAATTGPATAAPAAMAAVAPAASHRVLLAGLAAARHGTNEALAAIDARPHLTLLIRAGAGLEPAHLLAHPRVAVCTEAERRHLQGVSAVIAPSWCEAYLDEVVLAAARGIPIIATRRGAGFAALAAEIPPGDAHALGHALDRVLATSATDATERAPVPAASVAAAAAPASLLAPLTTALAG